MAHLAQQLTLREVADRLHLSVNTVKTHARRIYRKLEVSGRAEAVARWTRTPPP
jgi:LuxR family maltose regulon positive regulatory protein